MCIMALMLHFDSGRLLLLSALLLLALSPRVGADSESSSSSSSWNGRDAAGFSQRRLLQTLKPCSVNFAGVDYTPITSVCNPNTSTALVCCTAFLKFTCPEYAVVINDLTTDCATQYFNYLEYAGQYPSGFFQTTCQQFGDRDTGIPCPNAPAPAPAPASAPLPSGAAHLLGGSAATVALLAFHVLL